MNTLEASARSTPKETVKAFYEALDQGAQQSFAGIGTLFEARVLGATVLGGPGFLAFGEVLRSGFADGKHVFDVGIAEGDSVVTIGRACGRHTCAFMGAADTHREVAFTVMDLDGAQDGCIVEHRGIGDINTLWSQLGVEPPPSAEIEASSRRRVAELTCSAH